MPEHKRRTRDYAFPQRLHKARNYKHEPALIYAVDPDEQVAIMHAAGELNEQGGHILPFRIMNWRGTYIATHATSYSKDDLDNLEAMLRAKGFTKEN